MVSSRSARDGPRHDNCEAGKVFHLAPIPAVPAPDPTEPLARAHDLTFVELANELNLDFVACGELVWAHAKRLAARLRTGGGP